MSDQKNSFDPQAGLPGPSKPARFEPLEWPIRIEEPAREEPAREEPQEAPAEEPAAPEPEKVPA